MAQQFYIYSEKAFDDISNRHSGTHFDEMCSRQVYVRLGLALFSAKDTGECRKKSRNHDLPKYVPEWRFEISYQTAEIRDPPLKIIVKKASLGRLRDSLCVWVRV